MFLAKNYDLSSVVGAGGADDVGPFRLVFNHGAEAETFVATSGPQFPGKYPGDAIGQYRNLLLWISPADGSGQFSFALPSRIALVDDSGWKFGDAGGTWIALQPFAIGPIQPETNPPTGDAADQRKAAFGPDSFYNAKRGAASPGGFAMIVADEGDYPSFDAFRQAVKTRAKLDTSRLAQKTVRLTGGDGAFLEVTQSDTGLPVVNRNGNVRDWTDHKNWSLWQTVGGNLISLGWKEGTLNLTAGGKSYSGSVTLAGWETQDAAPKALEQTRGLKMTASFTNR